MRVNDVLVPSAGFTGKKPHLKFLSGVVATNCYALQSDGNYLLEDNSGCFELEN